MFDENPILIIPTVTSQDINQEIELLKLLGVENPSRRVVQMRLEGETPYSTFGDIVPASAEPIIPEDVDPLPDPEIYDKLIQWTLTQSEIIQKVVFDFLESPTDEGATYVINFLHDVCIITGRRRKATNHNTMTFAKFLMQQLRESPLTKDDIYHLARHNTNSKRPEAAARQLIRRFIEEGKIKDIGNDTYVAV